MIAAQDYAGLMGIKAEDLVQEVGWDEDCDTAISEAIEDVIGDALLDEDTDEMVDVVLLWWRKEDGDPTDGLVDSLRSLSDDGRVWLVSPGAGKPGSIDPGVIQEAAQTAGMVQTTSERLGDWQGACMVKGGGR
ncbi:DUF3052 domain-containing protein [Corynebacterium aquilae]|uniref:DUF3052 domain-containing protein n=1 Tax=Corynebacterium aquilae DSM 44791 TaxID=1431546 RepID=A0A1L7CH50_9CORY|nr:DUF3052 domain-containing protein [Corynebacterium aquilae]APT85166.1 hypothetical protein CAQU_08885 [Corynebacterium aquilae DSM 44791]